MTNTTAPADAAPAAFRTGAAPLLVDGALFLPASRHSALPKGANPFGAPAQAAARHTAAALRAQGQTAWAGVHAGAHGVFVALPF